MAAAAADRQPAPSSWLSWPDFFMSVTLLAAQRSKDPNTQVGACIVNEDKKVVGVGYNGMPRGCDDRELPWARTGPTEADVKYAYVCNAEMNAVLNRNATSLKGCTMYVALFPNNDSAKVIIQAGIKKIVYLAHPNADKKSYVAAKRMFDMAGVQLEQYTPSVDQVVIDFDAVEQHGGRQIAAAAAVPPHMLTEPTSTAAGHDRDGLPEKMGNLAM